MDSPNPRRPRLLTPVLLAALLTLVVLAALLGRTFLLGGSQPAAAQDGLIAFERYVENAPAPPQIAVINADGTDLIPLTTDGRAFDPARSPDGTRLAYYLVDPDNYRIGDFFVSGDIFVIDAGGSNSTRLTTDGRNLDPTWSPDGTKLAYVSDPASESGEMYDPPAQIFVMDADGSSPTSLTTDGENRDPAWSPDGTKIAYASTPAGGGKSAIYVMAADGANLTRLTPSDERGHQMDPAWSPDGTRIALASNREDYALRIYMMDADGANLTRLSPEYGTAPAWAPAAAAEAP
ncbi:MAG: hypothetical protein M3464_02765 [Chloroflexota bacterium]|nr:hypothetical protein [Chloroflexota bacterium]